jgi:hypothetical protein
MCVLVVIIALVIDLDDAVDMLYCDGSGCENHLWVSRICFGHVAVDKERFSVMMERAGRQ